MLICKACGALMVEGMLRRFRRSYASGASLWEDGPQFEACEEIDERVCPECESRDIEDACRCASCGCWDTRVELTHVAGEGLLCACCLEEDPAQNGKIYEF